MGNRLPRGVAVRQRLVHGNQPDGLLAEPQRRIEGPGAGIGSTGVELDAQASPRRPGGHAGHEEAADALALRFLRDDQLAEVAAWLTGPVPTPRCAGEPDDAGGRLGNEDDPVVIGWCGKVLGHPASDGGGHALGI